MNLWISLIPCLLSWNVPVIRSQCLHLQELGGLGARGPWRWRHCVPSKRCERWGFISQKNGILIFNNGMSRMLHVISTADRVHMLSLQNVGVIYLLKNKRPTWCHNLSFISLVYARHISDINTSIIRSLRLFYCITTLVVCSCFDVCWSFGK